MDAIHRMKMQESPRSETANWFDEACENVRNAIKKSESQRYEALWDDERGEGFLLGLKLALETFVRARGERTIGGTLIQVELPPKVPLRWKSDYE